MHVKVAFPSVLCSRRGVAPAHAHLSHSASLLCIFPLFFLRFPRDQGNLYLPTSFLFWDLRPLWCRPHQSKPAQLTHTSLPAAGATAVHQTGVRYTLCSFLRVLLVPDVYTHVSTAVRVVSADLGFYTSRRHRARAYVITGIHICLLYTSPSPRD